MKPISEWPLFVRLGSAVAIIGTLTTAWSYKDALAEAIPFPTKEVVTTQINDQIAGLNDLLDKILWNQMEVQFHLLETDISNLRTQKIELNDAIEHETNPTESIQKRVRYDAIDHELTTKLTQHDCIARQIAAQDVNAECTQ